jgi:23S rRNA (cytidine1920-2'-O)/16S rRNA (cytidine1409-2'-O)-methyltransferase
MVGVRKQRLDLLLVERGLCESREKAQRLIGAGAVRVDGQVAAKAGHSFPPEARIEVEAGERFVGRGGLKMEGALKAFGDPAAGAVCLDAGASTGGFTDCLLQHGAGRVYAVDVGKGQLHWKLRSDPRVVVMDGVNARHLDAVGLPEAVDLAVVDVSFISLTLVLPAVTSMLKAGGRVIALVKPQFEAGRAQVGQGGVVRDPAVHQQVVEKVRRFAEEQLGLAWQGTAVSPLQGPAGNVEFFVHWKKP